MFAVRLSPFCSLLTPWNVPECVYSVTISSAILWEADPRVSNAVRLLHLVPQIVMPSSSSNHWDCPHLSRPSNS